ncbi:uncharacterized protein LOC128853954 isoform X3 [Cuculus canorus]|uniref:uncharacterized protein LOC128853954 isoform X3 n=1 Tax=Cuculus canorus TaxID=55661 RepID=UPI0023AB1F60|nr:uncharacterized protein LOC128853954 isoform X3 [Cuculus canorus]
MARKEPLLSALKGGVLWLRESGGPCSDTSPLLASLCQLLESILRKGLRQPAWGFRRRDYWHWLEQLPVEDGGRPTPFSVSIQKAGSCVKARTAQGRGRCFLRLALQGKVLAAAVQQLVRSPQLLEFYDPVSSILGNEDLLGAEMERKLLVSSICWAVWSEFGEIGRHDTALLSPCWQREPGMSLWQQPECPGAGMLPGARCPGLISCAAKGFICTSATSPRGCGWQEPDGDAASLPHPSAEPFLSLLLVLAEMDFCLDLQNCSFLDESWLLPVCITYETVPCRALGMVLRYVDGRVFITKVLPESQAELDEVVLAGDVLDEINGCSLRNAYNGQAGAELQKVKGQPLSLRLLRWRWHDGEVYEPLMPYLKVLKEQEPCFQLQRSPRCRAEGDPRGLQGGRLLYALRYLGQAGIGKHGGKEVLGWAIPTVLEQHSAAWEVLLDVKEAEILVQEKASSKLLGRYPYPCISCVGRCADSRNLLAFCVATSLESPGGSTFDCLVFAARSEQECEEIVRSIGKAPAPGWVPSPRQAVAVEVKVGNVSAPQTPH